MTLSVQDLEFKYGKKQVLEDINISIGKGRVVSILGPNGVGKTTLLKCICRIFSPSSGRIMVDETDVTSINRKELAKIISYVPQRAIPSYNTVFDSVLIGRKPHTEWALTQEDLKKVEDALKLFGMNHLSLKYLDEISGGELQKVQIARAYVQEAEIMILDEPTNNLDISNQHNILHLLSELTRKKNVTAIMTMHDLNLALSYSDEFIFVKNGQIVSFGGKESVTPEVIKDVFNIDCEIIERNGTMYMLPFKDQSFFETL